jgi:hypothetical protein
MHNRAFLEDLLPIFRKENPQLQVIEELRPGHHPYLKAEYGGTFIPQELWRAWSTAVSHAFVTVVSFSDERDVHSVQLSFGMRMSQRPV